MAELELPSRENDFAETIKQARDAGMLPNEDGTTTTPEKEEKVEKSEAQPKQEGKQRDPATGKFLKTDAAPKEEAEPFAGFKDLPDDVKAQWNALLGRAQRSESELTQLRRQNGALLGQVPNLQREVQRLQRSSREAPTQQKVADLKAMLKRFPEYKERYPDDAAAIEELFDATRQELAATKAALANEVGQLKQTVQSFVNERTVQENTRVQDQLDREHPDWRIIAGWQDAEGNAVDPTNADFHPHFKAWKQALPPELQADFDQKLNSRSANLIGHVFDAFERDYQAAVEFAEGQGAGTATETDPVRTRRSEALRDVSPTGSASASIPNERKIQSHRMSQEDDYAATIALARADPRFAHWSR